MFETIAYTNRAHNISVLTAVTLHYLPLNTIGIQLKLIESFGNIAKCLS